MILENKPPSEDEKLVDAPPSYDEANSSQPRPVFQTGSSTEKSSSRPRFPSTSGADLDSAPVASSSRIPTPSPINASFSKSREQHASAPAAKLSPKSQADVRTTVLGLVRDVVQKGTATVGADAARGILESCANACTAHGVPLGRVLQERSVEGHTPIYWAVVNRRRGSSGTNPANMNSGGNGAEREDKDILFLLLAHAGQLSPSSVADLRLACLVTADNVFYQRLRTSPAMNSLSGTDRMLLSGWHDTAGSDTGLAEASNRPKGRRFFADVAGVLEGDNNVDAGAFSVRLEIAMFQRRMRVSNEITIEFIARGRLWDLCFFVVPSSPSPAASTTSSSSSSSPAPSSGRHETSSQRRSLVPKAALAAARGRGIVPGSWVACLSLLAHSPPCSADARLVIPEPELERNPTPPAGTPPPLPPRRPSTPTLISFNHDRPPTHPRSSPSMFNLGQRSKPPTGPGGPKPPIFLRLTSPFGHTGELVPPLPPPADEVTYSFEIPGASTAKAKRKARRREARAATRAQREHEGKEKQAVLIARFEEQVAGRGEDKGGCLMYDGCSYIAPDGTLRAVLETRIRGTGARARSDMDCVIC